MCWEHKNCNEAASRETDTSSGILLTAGINNSVLCQRKSNVQLDRFGLKSNAETHNRHQYNSRFVFMHASDVSWRNVNKGFIGNPGVTINSVFRRCMTWASAPPPAVQHTLHSHCSIPTLLLRYKTIRQLQILCSSDLTTDTSPCTGQWIRMSQGGGGCYVEVTSKALIAVLCILLQM